MGNGHSVYHLTLVLLVEDDYEIGFVLNCNTPGVCHQLSSGFKLNHDMLSGNEGVKIKSI